MDATIIAGKINWYLELDEQAFAELKCQKLKKEKGVNIAKNFIKMNSWQPR